MPFWNQSLPRQIIGFDIEMGSMYAGVSVMPCLLARFNMQQARLERKGDIIPS